MKLLWKETQGELNSNFEIAKQRILGLKNRFKKNPRLIREYNEIFKEQFNEGVIEECKFNKDEVNACYMPHAPVIREDIRRLPR